MELSNVTTEVLLKEIISRGGSISQLAKAALLQEQKAKDYNGGIVKREDYFPFGLLSYAQMLHTKALRLDSLASQQMTGSNQPQFESVKDTALDMINYASFLADYLQNRNEEAASDSEHATTTFGPLLG